MWNGHWTRCISGVDGEQRETKRKSTTKLRFKKLYTHLEMCVSSNKTEQDGRRRTMQQDRPECRSCKNQTVCITYCVNKTRRNPAKHFWRNAATRIHFWNWWSASMRGSIQMAFSCSKLEQSTSEVWFRWLLLLACSHWPASTDQLLLTSSYWPASTDQHPLAPIRELQLDKAPSEIIYKMTFRRINKLWMVISQITAFLL